MVKRTKLNSKKGVMWDTLIYTFHLLLSPLPVSLCRVSCHLDLRLFRKTFPQPCFPPTTTSTGCGQQKGHRVFGNCRDTNKQGNFRQYLCIVCVIVCVWCHYVPVVEACLACRAWCRHDKLARPPLWTILPLVPNNYPTCPS